MTSCSERVYVRGEEKGKALYPQMDLILVSPGSVVALGLSVGVETTGEKHWKHKVPPSSRREEAAGGEHGEEVEVSQLPTPAQRKDNGVPKVKRPPPCLVDTSGRCRGFISSPLHILSFIILLVLSLPRIPLEPRAHKDPLSVIQRDCKLKASHSQRVTASWKGRTW